MMSRESICLGSCRENPVLGKLVDSTPSKSISSQNLGSCEIPDFSFKTWQLKVCIIFADAGLRTEVTIEGLSFQGNSLFWLQVCI